MATLSSTSTLSDVLAAYDDNASYAEDGDAAKAMAFVTACRILLRRIPKRAAHGGRGGNEIEIDPVVLRAELTAAQQWVADRATATASARHFTFGDFGR